MMEHRIIQVGAYEFAVESEIRHGKVKGKRTVGGFGTAGEAQAWLEARLAWREPAEVALPPEAPAAGS